MKDCIFCKIVNGEIPSKVIHEDDIVKVIMNINPEQNGDLLIVAKRHFPDYSKIKDEEIVHINHVIKELKELLTDKLKPTGMQLITNAGTCQEIKHFHIHMTPGYEPSQPIVDVDIMYDKLTK